MAERRVALVTGATSGIGFGIARRLAAAGYAVAAQGLEAEDAAAVAELRGGTDIAYFQANLRDGEAGYALVERVGAALGSVDILVNNAGVQKVSPVEDFQPADWDAVRTISLDASFHTIRAAVPMMVKNGWGRIINMASAHGLRASPFKSAYVAAKHGVVGLTKSVALEVAEKGITVNAICPGYVWTPLVAKQVQDQAKVHGISEDEVIRKVMLAPQPTRQFVTVEEVAELAAYLCGDLARSITGTTISIDGGWTAK